ncbi:MAG: hypothetical protein ACYTKD_32480 [Planctomycetota bacterium]|jgi:hypothetical protein
MILGKLKLYLIAGAGVALTVLLATVKILTLRNSRLRERVEHAEATVHVARVVAKKDMEVERQTRRRRAEAMNEIKDTGDSTDFRNPNRLFDRTDD